MAETTLFDASYEHRKKPLLIQALERLRPIYSKSELDALRIDSMSREGLAQRSGPVSYTHLTLPTIYSV